MTAGWAVCALASTERADLVRCRVVIEIDESAFPLVLIEISEGFGRSEWESYVSLNQRNFEAGRSFGVALRATRVPMPELALLKDVGKWVNDNSEMMARYTLFTAMCLPSAVLRGAIKFINSVAPPPIEQGIFEDWDEALAWCRQRL